MLDVFHEHTRTLALQKRGAVQGTFLLTGDWREWDGTVCVNAQLVLGYVARVRLASGEIIEGDDQLVLNQLRQLTKSVATSVLDTTPPPK